MLGDLNQALRRCPDYILDLELWRKKTGVVVGEVGVSSFARRNPASLLLADLSSGHFEYAEPLSQ
jgi:hypothetical protein